MTITPETSVDSGVNLLPTAFNRRLKQLHTLAQTYSPWRYQIYIGWFGGIQIHPR